MDLTDSLRELKKVSDEAEVTLKQTRLQEEEVLKILGQHMETWEAAEGNIEARAESAWPLTQRKESGTRLGEFPELGEGNFWTKDMEDMAKVWKEKKERA